MFKKKNLSVIFAVVLLCASVAGVLFIGAQAADTKYYMTVGDPDGAYATKVSSDMSFIANYSNINEAITAAAGRTWATKDTLTIYVAADGTTASFGSGVPGRHLFNTYTIFRDDNTKLPIEINGDDPSTQDVEQHSLGLGTPTWNKDFSSAAMTASFIAANDYTFKNMDLSAWASSAYIFYAGTGRVTFDNVLLSTSSSNEKLTLCSQVGAWTPFTGWNQAKFDANKSEDDVVDGAFIFKNTKYGYANGTLTTRCSNLNISGDQAVNDLTINNKKTRSQLVFLEGSNAQNVFIHSVNGMTADRAPFENEIVVDGGYVAVVYGVRSTYTGAANRHVCTVKSGTLAHVRMGSQNKATYTGDIVINWEGGSIQNYGSVFSGTVVGNVYNNINKQNITGVVGLAASKGYGVGFNATATIQGSLYNNLTGCTLAGTVSINGTVSDTLNNTFTDCTLEGDVYLGGNGKAVNYVNSLSGTINTTDDYAYCGVKDATISGTVTNNIACDWVYSKDANHYLMGGSANGDITGKITNNILPGAHIRYDFIGGSNGGEVSSIENYIKGGEVQNFLGGNSFNNNTALASIKNILTGGVISTFYGASGNYASSTAHAVISKVENILGQQNEDGSFAGDAHVYSYWGGGGASDRSVRIGEIENTFYSGKFGTADRSSSAWYTSYTAYGGSRLGVVGVVRNTFHGGTFNIAYYYGGNGPSAVFGTDGGYTLAEGESQVTNYVYGGHFGRFAGGSNGGNISTIKNFVHGSAEGSISVRDSAFYCAHGSKETTTVENIISGFAPVSLGNDGQFTESTDMKGVIYGGTNADTVGTIKNTIKNDAVIGTFYGGSNGGLAKNITTTITKDADSEAEPEIVTYFGGGRAPGDPEGKVTKTTDLITNNVEAGFVKEYYAANYRAKTTGHVTAIVNNLKGGEIHLFFGGNNQDTESVKNEDGTSTTNYILGTINNVTNNVNSGSTVRVDFFYGAGKTGTVGTVKNYFKSSTASFGAAYGGLFGIDSYKRPTEGGVASDIQNIITTGEFEVFTGGSRRAKSVHIVNSVTGGAFGEFYGANNQASLENTTDELAVQTNISNATFTGNVYGGSYYGDITGNIKTIFTSGTFGGNTFTGNRFGNITGSVAGTINGGTFNRYFGGSDGLDVYGTKSYPSVTVITGDVINYINGGTFTGANPSKDTAVKDFALILGGNYGNIVGSVTNNFTNASGSAPAVASGKMSLGGGFMNNITASGSNGYAIKTTISAGTFYSFWGGSYRNDTSGSYKVTGNIINTVNGGTFNTYDGTTSYNAFAGSCVNAGHEGNVTNTFNGGTFKGCVNGGMYIVDSTTYGSKKFCKGQVSSTISSSFSGSFGSTFYVCGRYGAYYNTAGTSVLKATLTKNGASVTSRTYNSGGTTTGTVK